MSWTAKRIEILVSMWKDGQRASAIAQSLQVSRGAALGKLDRLGLLGKMSRAEKLRRQHIGTSLRQRPRRRGFYPSTVTKLAEIIERCWPSLSDDERSLLRNAVHLGDLSVSSPERGNEQTNDSRIAS